MGNGFDDNEPLVENVPELPEGTFDAPGVPDGFREAVWRRTARTLRRRVRRRWAVAVCTVVVAYAAGLATMYTVQDGRYETPAPIASVPPEPDAGPGTAVVSAPPVTPWHADAGSVALLLDHEALSRRIAEASREERLRLLKWAGDRYLRELGDVQRALNCYRWLLNATPPAQRTVVEPDDSWLLVSLKQARQKEMIHENATT